MVGAAHLERQPVEARNIPDKHEKQVVSLRSLLLSVQNGLWGLLHQSHDVWCIASHLAAYPEAAAVLVSAVVLLLSGVKLLGCTRELHPALASTSIMHLLCIWCLLKARLRPEQSQPQSAAREILSGTVF